ncbi:MAG TPA: HlyD family type I secretion periplasmic adaptor subunit [Alphaproteobacteria bacterium]|nr:HlyD family type I secretion periplasmic adaptor subunit [Alphaproteobacteria bacterium]
MTSRSLTVADEWNHRLDADLSLQNLADSRHGPLTRILLVGICVMFAGLIAWASLARVDQVVSALGTVRPAGKTKMINHPDGGRVVELYVHEGDTVEAGQVLLAFDGAALEQDVIQRKSEFERLSAEIARLEAEGTHAPLTFPDEIASMRPDLVEAETRLFSARLDALATQRAEADSAVSQRNSEMATLSDRVAQLKASVAILREQEAAVGKLAEKGYFPRVRYLSLKRDLVTAEGELAQAEDAKASAISAHSEALERRQRIDRERDADVLSKLAASRGQRDQIVSQLRQSESRAGHLKIVSPVSGVVQNLAVKNVGQSIAANQSIMEIVPRGDSLVVEARVENRDIGNVRIDQPATIKVRAFDFVKFGTLRGKVEHIAPDASKEDGASGSFFLVTVRTDATELSDSARRVSIAPGMLVDVDLKVGRRTIMSYLTDRIFEATDSAFKE